MIVEVKNCVKRFGQKTAVNDLSFEVEEGEVFAFLGSNGSGKTTTIRCLLGIYSADSGELLIEGKKYQSQMSQMLGYLPEERGLYVNDRVMDTLVYFGKLKGMKESRSRKRAQDYLEMVELGDKANEQIKKLSSGQQQKIQLGLALINQPKLLILDEPTKGLDPVNRRLLMQQLKNLNKQGSSIMFTSHQMEQVEEICDRLVMIKNGKRVLYGKLNEIKKEYADGSVFVEAENHILKKSDVYTYSIKNKRVILKPKSGNNLHDILQFLVKKNIKITRFEQKEPTLDEIFVMQQTK